MIYPDYNIKPQIIAFANQKGGVGKTTNALNLAYVEANKFAKKILLIDFDSQASSSLDLGVPLYDDNEQLVTIDMLLKPLVESNVKPSWEYIKKAILKPTYATKQRVIENGKQTMKWEDVDKPFGFDLIPSSLGLSITNFEMQMMGGKYGKILIDYLADLIDVIIANKDYDMIIIDLPPALDSLSMCGIRAARSGVIISSNMDLMSFRGVKPCRESIESARRIAKREGVMHRGILGILLSQYSDRRQNDRSLKVHSNSFEPSATFKTQIPDSADARKAVSMGLLFCQLNRKAEDAYIELATEIELAISNPKAFITQWEDRREREAEHPEELEKYSYEELLLQEQEDDEITFAEIKEIAKKRENNG